MRRNHGRDCGRTLVIHAGASLLMRRRLEIAAEKGMLADSAMIAHGRGEAFTISWASERPRARPGPLDRRWRRSSADRPVLSINGTSLLWPAMKCFSLPTIFHALLK